MKRVVLTAAIKGMLAEIWLSEGLVEPAELDSTLAKVAFASLDEWRAALAEEGGDALALQGWWTDADEARIIDDNGDWESDDE